MIVSNSKYGYDSYNAYAQNQMPNRQNAKLSDDAPSQLDTVTISEEAKRLSMQADEKTLPLEANALPSWFDKYIVPSSVQSSKVDHDFWNFIGGLTSDNTISADEKAQIKERLQKDSAHRQMLANDKFASEHKTDIKNYTTSLNNYFSEALKENGITSKQDYYHKVILNKDTSEQVHQAMASKIKNDSGMLKLMDVLGVKRVA